MKLNMGCGRNKLPGWVNVDSAAAAEPDEVCDLETIPWPWPDSVASEVMFNHSLEHMGGDPKVFLAMMRELYRIAAPGCRITIYAPHPRHDDFIGDPTHVRPITPAMLMLFDRRANDVFAEKGASNTPFAHYLNVDFRIVDRKMLLEEPYDSQVKSGELSPEEALRLVRERNNIAKEFRIVLEAVKP